MNKTFFLAVRKQQKLFNIKVDADYNKVHYVDHTT